MIQSLSLLCYNKLDKNIHKTFFNNVLNELKDCFEKSYISEWPRQIEPTSRPIHNVMIPNENVYKILYLTRNKAIRVSCPMICSPSTNYCYIVTWSWDLGLQDMNNRQYALHLPLPLQYF